MSAKRITLIMMCWITMTHQLLYSQCIPDQSVMTYRGETEVEICLGSNKTSIYARPKYQSSPTVYAITDEQDMILDVVYGSKIDFGGAPPGICRVYGISWWGTLQTPIDISVHDAVFSDFCYEVSTNYIQVTRTSLGSGTVQTADGATEVYTCPGDGIEDIVSFSYDGTSEAGFTYVITDENYQILGLPEGESQDFEGAGVGVCLVWGLNYQGDLLAEVGGHALNDQLATGCFGLTDNSITVTRATPAAGKILTMAGEEEISLCVGDGISDEIDFAGEGQSNAGYRLVVTDDQNNIVGLPPGLLVDFEGAGQGVCRVWAVSYTGSFLLEMGQHLLEANISSSCSELTENYVEVNRTQVNGGTVSTSDTLTRVYTCTQDDIDDIFSFMAEGAMGEHHRFVITTPDLEILGIVDSIQNFDGAPPGTCWVWGLAYSGELLAMVGDNAGEVALSSGCYDLSDNFVEVIRDVPDGGTVSLPSGDTEVYTCTQDENPDLIRFQHEGASNSKYTYVITTPDLEILGITDADSMNFNDAPPGTCWVWGLAYTGSLTASLGENAGEVALSDDCFDLSDSFIKVTRDIPDGGQVSTPTGDTVAYTCPQDGKADFVNFAHSGASNSKYTYIITDPSLEILGITEEEKMDFDAAPAGTCWVWGLAYTGDLIASVGDNAGEIMLSDDCFDLSDNYISVIRQEPEGGTVAMPSGNAEVQTCTQDSTGDVVMFEASGQSDSKYAYIITAPSLEILGVEFNDSHDFNDAPPGTCWVWGLAYTGEITAKVGEQADEVQLTSGCADLSDNYITVIRTSPDGGQVSMPSGDTVVHTCTQDSVADVVGLSHQNNSGPNYVYIITSPDLEILGIETNSTHDFNDAPPGTCWVWGLAYTGNLTAEVGQNAGEVALSDACFDLSENYITVIRDMPMGGTIAMTSGETTRYTCTHDGSADVVAFETINTSNSKYAYIITSPTLEILGIEFNDSHDFNDAPPGTCWVWGLAYTGNIIAEVGDQADAVSLTDDCYDLSDNYITVIRDIPEGGMIAMPSGETTRYTCTQDGTEDLVEFSVTGASNSKYAYVITSPSLEILGIEFNDSHDFDDAPPGTCWVWGLAYTGELKAEVGDQADEVDLSSDCADLSDNYITVIRDSIDGGTVATNLGDTEVSTIAGDGNADLIQFTHLNASNSKYAYVITNVENEILGLPDGDSQDFEGAGAGVCRVWGLAYTGAITAQVGDDADSVALSDDCYDLSDNFITITRSESGAGLALQRGPQVGKPSSGSLALMLQNPVVGRIMGQITVELRTDLQVSLHSYHGVEIRSETIRNALGLVTLDWDTGDLSKGLYLITIFDGKQLVSEKLAIH
ncbi:MAG: hypothetical protein HKN87_07975 [Saprospiraceae bacterium]|nr:hypothetical protein [Saprospiraceae bacterium]